MDDKGKCVNTGNPLVSVCIITYNSSKYILEALESVYNQTYHNIELIVSDDGSLDDTVELTEKWLQNKKQRFVNVRLLTVQHNTGTSKNSNRALFASKGEWFKYFAGDDVLFPDAIENYINYITTLPQANWIYAKAKCFDNTISDESKINKNTNRYDKSHKKLNDMDCGEQLKQMYIGNFLNFPTHFLRRRFFLEMGGFDEDFVLLEDYPTWLNLMIHGEKCYYIDKYVLGYRKSSDNVYNNSKILVNRQLENYMFNAKKKYLFERCNRAVKLHVMLKHMISTFFSHPLLNSRVWLYPVYRYILISLNLSLVKFMK